jgi:hypothetical protein
MLLVSSERVGCPSLVSDTLPPSKRLSRRSTRLAELLPGLRKECPRFATTCIQPLSEAGSTYAKNPPLSTCRVLAQSRIKSQTIEHNRLRKKARRSRMNSGNSRNLLRLSSFAFTRICSRGYTGWNLSHARISAQPTGARFCAGQWRLMRNSIASS